MALRRRIGVAVLVLLLTACVTRSDMFPRNISALTLGPIIVTTPANARDAALMCHERHHVRQYQHLGATFWPRYFWESLKRGYWDNKYEVDAREAEKSCLP